MTTYVGPLGGLIRVPCLSDLSERVTRRRVWHEGIDGSPAVTLGNPGKAWRTWSCAITAVDPGDLAQWQQAAIDQDAPWWFVPCGSTTQNVMTRRASFWYDWQVSWSQPSIPPRVTRAGPVITEDGRAQSSALFDYDGDTWAYQSPVVPVDPDGTAAVAAVYVRAFPGKTAQVRIVWTDGSGSDLGSGYVTESTTNATSPLVRVVAQAAPSPGAAGYRIQVRRAVQAALPAQTWGGVFPWTAGKATDRAVIGDPSEGAIIHAPDNRWSSSQLEVREVR